MTYHEISVAVGGGHELDQAGLAALIASLPGLHVVSIDKNPPPQVLVWLVRKDIGDVPAVRADTPLLLLIEDIEDESLPEIAMGLFSRDESPNALGIAIRQVSRGQQYLSPSLATAILQERQTESLLVEPEKAIIDSLTDREREILNFLAQGLSNKLIASRLYLSVRTIEGHLANIYLRLGVHSRTEAMLMAVKIPKSTGAVVR